jgi:hypothetical protein
LNTNIKGFESEFNIIDACSHNSRVFVDIRTEYNKIIRASHYNVLLKRNEDKRSEPFEEQKLMVLGVNRKNQVVITEGFDTNMDTFISNDYSAYTATTNEGYDIFIGANNAIPVKLLDMSDAKLYKCSDIEYIARDYTLFDEPTICTLIPNGLEASFEIIGYKINWIGNGQIKLLAVVRKIDNDYLEYNLLNSQCIIQSSDLNISRDVVKTK